MADLSVEYMGLKLSHPLVAGSSPLADTTDGARRLEESGASAVVLRSLFEEQIDGAAPGGAVLGPDEYVAHVARLKKLLRIPVLASLNGAVRGEWLGLARKIEDAGADALELNLYLMSTDAWDPPQVIERRTEEVVRAVKALVRIPVAVKLSAFYTSVPNIVQRLDVAGADGFVLFNRYALPDLDLETGVVAAELPRSDPAELPQRLHAVALLYGRVHAPVAVSGGVQSAVDALKAVAVGAHAVQAVSALYRHGPAWLGRARDGMSAWLDDHGIPSIAALRGRYSLARCADPRAWQRAVYRRALGGVGV